MTAPAPSGAAAAGLAALESALTGDALPALPSLDPRALDEALRALTRRHGAG